MQSLRRTAVSQRSSRRMDVVIREIVDGGPPLRKRHVPLSFRHIRHVSYGYGSCSCSSVLAVQHTMVLPVLLLVYPLAAPQTEHTPPKVCHATFQDGMFVVLATLSQYTSASYDNVPPSSVIMYEEDALRVPALRGISHLPCSLAQSEADRTGGAATDVFFHTFDDLDSPDGTGIARRDVPGLALYGSDSVVGRGLWRGIPGEEGSECAPIVPQVEYLSVLSFGADVKASGATSVTVTQYLPYEEATVVVDNRGGNTSLEFLVPSESVSCLESGLFLQDDGLDLSQLKYVQGGETAIFTIPMPLSDDVPADPSARGTQYLAADDGDANWDLDANDTMSTTWPDNATETNDSTTFTATETNDNATFTAPAAPSSRDRFVLWRTLGSDGSFSCAPSIGEDECETFPPVCGLRANCIDEALTERGTFRCKCRSEFESNETDGGVFGIECVTSDEQSLLMLILIISVAVLFCAAVGVGIFMYMTQSRAKFENDKLMDLELMLQHQDHDLIADVPHSATKTDRALPMKTALQALGSDTNDT